MRGVDEMFATMAAMGGERNDAIYVRLTGLKEGMAIGRTPLPKLPPSRRAVLGASGRPDTVMLSDDQLSVVPMDCVISGTAEATIHVKKKLP